MRAEDNSQMTTLSPQSYQIVMTAIKHAKLKGHCQVQPMHVAAALLDPVTRSLALHNACLQSLKDPNHALKCEALDLCFKVALERLPVITDPEKCKDQSMSNALGAALKRAHANERRGTPEQSLQPLLAVKTGIAHLTISILDDPSVSRVFKEAGFSSTDVKNNMEEAVAKAALAGPVPSPSLDNPGMRRMQFSMAPFSSARLDSVQFRNSFLSSPFAPGDPSNTHGKLLERGRMCTNGMDVLADRESPYFGSCIARQDPDASARFFGPTAPILLDSPLHQKRQEQAWMPGRSSDNASLRTPTCRHDADVRNIMETLIAGPKKRNPVLVSDSGPNSVLKELSQGLMRGDVPLLAGVQFLDLPFTSLSAGILSHEAFEQKLAKLKRDVDGCMQTGGAIISVGDLAWLVEPSHSVGSLVLQELRQLMSSNAYNRLWLLASASPKTLERCRVNSLSLMDSLGLHPIILTPDTSGSVLQPRHGSHNSTKNAELSFLSQPGIGKLPTVKPALIQTGLEKADCCPDCSSKFQQECSALIKEEQTLYLGSGPPPAYAKLPWMQNQKDKIRAALPVKEEENLVSHRIEDLRQKWQQQCSVLHSHGSLSSAGSGVSRDHSSSPVAEIVSPQERNPRLSLPMLPTQASSKWAPQPGKMSDGKSLEFAPLHARIARGNNIPNYVSSSNPAISSKNGESELKRVDESGGRSPLSWMRRDPGGASGLTLSMKPNVLVGKSSHLGASMGTDLALGRSSLGTVSSQTRDIREEGQQPLHSSRSQLPHNSKTVKMSPHSSMMRSSDTDYLNGLCWSLSNAVAWQKEAVGAVASAVAKCRSGEGRKTGAYARTDAWLMFLGPDRVGKREVARALAKIVFGREDNFILVTGWQTDSSGRTPPSTGILAADSNGVKFRGKTPLDRLAEAVQRKPFSVVLLEDIDSADSFLKKNLIKAMERGRLADSSGREVSLGNAIVIMTCGAGASFLTNQRNPQGQGAMEFDEDKLSGLGPCEVRLLIENTASPNVLHMKGKGLSIVDSIKTELRQEAVKDEEKPAESILLFGSPMFKRKANSVLQGDDSRGSISPPAKMCKREECSPSRAFSLDLNLSVEENSSEDEEPCITEELSETSAPESLEELTAKAIECARGKCPAEMFAMLDAAVVFKPFNLNGLMEWVLGTLESALEDVTRTVRVPVEVDKALLEVMVSSAWSNFSKPEAIEGWVNNVLMQAISGLLEKGSLPPDAVVKVMDVERDLSLTPELYGNGSSRQLLPTTIQLGQ